MSRGKCKDITGFGNVFAAALVGSLAMLAAGAAQATSYAVNTLLDANSARIRTCGLRDAINAANGTPNSTSSCNSPGTGNDTITFSLTGTITLGGPLPAITDTDLTIIGPTTSPGITINGATKYQVLFVGSGSAPTLTLKSLTIEDGNGQSQSAESRSGGLGIANATAVNIADCTFLNNRGGGNSAGGAIVVAQGTLNVTNSTFSGNRVGTGGGSAIFVNIGSTANVTNSMFSGNSAPVGGAILVAGEPTLVGIVNLRGTILAANTGGNCDTTGGTLKDDGYNISDDSSCGFSKTGSANNGVNVNPMLAAFASNGGPTMTFALKSDSPAIDAIPQDDCTYLAGPNPCTTSGSIPNQLACDQRGFIRPALGQENCDIGAVEGVAAPSLGAPEGTCEDGCIGQVDRCSSAFDSYYACLDSCSSSVTCEDRCQMGFDRGLRACRKVGSMSLGGGPR